MPVPGKEKWSHLHFYLHNNITGSRPSSVKVAEPLSGSSGNNAPSSIGGFGSVFIADDPLTAGPSPSSPVVGRAQGMYAQASQESGHNIAFMEVFNFVLEADEFKGSTFTLVGREEILDPVRELTVVGGTGKFRMATGYATFETSSVDYVTGNVVIDVDAYILHY